MGAACAAGIKLYAATLVHGLIGPSAYVYPLPKNSEHES
jgi:hypothetical protein